MAKAATRSRKQVSASGRTCSIAGCSRPEQAKGLCHAHYVRQSKGITLQGKIRKQRPRLTEKEVERAIAAFKAGKKIAHIAADLEISKPALQKRLRAAGLR